MDRKHYITWTGIALVVCAAAWSQDAVEPKPEAAAAAKPEAAPPAQAAAPAPTAAPLPAASAGPVRPPKAAEVNPERMKDMQTLHGLRRDYHMARRAVTEKQQKLRDNPDVNKQVTGIDEQIRQLQEQIRTLEESKPGVFRQADESLQADYEKMADVERQIQELEKKLYPGRPVKPAAPGVQGAPPPPPAPPAAPAAPQPPAAPAQDQ